MAAQTNKSAPEPSHILSLLSPAALQELAQEKTYERGERYFNEGRVSEIDIYGDTLTAEVSGTEVYNVRLRIEQRQLDYECDCPVGEWREFCKHCVAAALAWADRVRNGGIPAGSDLAVIEGMLRTLSKDDLTAIIIERAMADERFRGSLETRALLGRHGKPRLSDYREAIEKATHVEAIIDRRQVRAFSARVMEVARSIADVATEEIDGSELPELMEYLILRTTRVLPGVYDADGQLGGILEELERMHYKLCARSHPDPLKLADRLVHLQLEGGADLFYDAFGTYAALLGKKGQRRYRELVIDEWSRCDHPTGPAPGARAHPPEQFDPRYTALRTLMGAIANYTGEIEDRVNILRVDLTAPYHYIRIARLYSEAKMRDKALDWARKGLAAFPSDTGLMEFMIEEHARGKDFAAALDLAWELFTQAPSFTTYSRLKKYAEKSRSWRAWRQRAIALIQALPAEGQSGGSPLLVWIFLQEKDDDAAWEQAIAGGCSDELWLLLADARTARHPEDAIAIYEAQIEKLGEHTDSQSYKAVIDLLKKMKKLMESLGRHEEFREYLTELRTSWKRRRTFIRLLDETKGL